jgi:hypothetical protein
MKFHLLSNKPLFLREERLNLLTLQRFLSIDLGFHDSGPMVRQNILGVATCGGGGSPPHSSQEAE